MVWFSWAVLLSLLAYFINKNALHYFVVTPESYGDYFWPKASWLFPHVLGGLFAAVIGPLQFWPRIRRDFLAFHRIAGRIYVVTVLLGSVAALGLASTIEDAAAYSLGLVGLAVAWLTTTAMAFVAIRRSNLVQHKQWMVRSYVVTFAFISFRLADELMDAFDILSGPERARLLAWSCWAVPLLFAEVAIQAKAVFKIRTV